MPSPAELRSGEVFQHSQQRSRCSSPCYCLTGLLAITRVLQFHPHANQFQNFENNICGVGGQSDCAHEVRWEFPIMRAANDKRRGVLQQPPGAVGDAQSCQCGPYCCSLPGEVSNPKFSTSRDSGQQIFRVGEQDRYPNFSASVSSRKLPPLQPSVQNKGFEKVDILIWRWLLHVDLRLGNPAALEIRCQNG